MKRSFITAMIALCGAASVHAQSANEILSASGVQGGLVVAIGCDDTAFIVALRVNDSYLVHALDTDAAKVAKAREYIQSKGLYGKVSVAQFDGKTLPYVDDCVNLVQVSGVECQVSAGEIERVLAPRGVALVPKGFGFEVSGLSAEVVGNWLVCRKPVPPEIDSWTHFLHDASGNGLAHDREVGPPKRLRWAAEPRWCRSHEFPSSVGAVVTDAGRIFTIFDEGPCGVFEKLPQNCKLIARDAANGVLLWKVPLQQWQPELGTGTGSRWHIHQTIPRRVIAKGERVYVTLQFLDSPVSVLDAATGKTLEVLEGTNGTDEMLLLDGVLVTKMTKKLSVNAEARISKAALDATLAGVDIETGKTLWRKEGIGVVPYTLAALAGRVVYHNMDELVCLDLKTGKEIWRTRYEIGSTLGGGNIIVLNDGVVLFHGNGVVPSTAAAGKDKNTPAKKRSALFLSAFSLADGTRLWRHPARKGWVAAAVIPADVFVSNGIVWSAGPLSGRDLKTGEIVKTLNVQKLISPGHHYRCHRSRATERYLILPKRGAEFADLQGENHMRHDWLRAPCYTGTLPANGLLYVPPSQCFCYPGAKVFGYLAMSADLPDKLLPSTDANLQRGKAYGKELAPDSRPLPPGSWPRYRHDIRFTGSTKTVVPVDLEERWSIKLGNNASPPVVVGNRLWVAEKDAQRIRCLDATSGKDVWAYTAAARIDSAPTIHDGLVLFGCRDGAVYCLRATDGELVWRFRASPDKRIVSFGQLESVWPIHGSVLVLNGVVYFAAGRSSFLDGGILVYGLEAATGKVLYHHLLEGPWPDIEKDTGTPFAMEGALPDLIVSDGKDLYMQRIKFDAQLNRLPVKKDSSLGELDMGANHLVATGGFLDDTGFDRLYWMHGRRWPGFYFAQFSPKAGQLVVFDESTTYAVKYFYRRYMWSPLFFPAEQGYLLFADDNDNQPILEDRSRNIKAIDWLPKEASSDKFRRGGRGVEKGTGYTRQRPEKWQTMIPLRVRAMVLAKDKLFAVGLPDVIDPKHPMAAFDGRKGSLLNAYSTKDGALLASHKLSTTPAFDGLIAAAGKLYLATHDGKVICYEGRE